MVDGARDTRKGQTAVPGIEPGHARHDRGNVRGAQPDPGHSLVLPRALPGGAARPLHVALPEAVGQASAARSRFGAAWPPLSGILEVRFPAPRLNLLGAFDRTRQHAIISR